MGWIGVEGLGCRVPPWDEQKAKGEWGADNPLAQSYPQIKSSAASVLFSCFDAALADPPEHMAQGSGCCPKPCPAVRAAQIALCPLCSPLPSFGAGSCLYKRGSFLAESSKLLCTWAKHAAH